MNTSFWVLTLIACIVLAMNVQEDDLHSAWVNVDNFVMIVPWIYNVSALMKIIIVFYSSCTFFEIEANRKRPFIGMLWLWDMSKTHITIQCKAFGWKILKGRSKLSLLESRSSYVCSAKWGVFWSLAFIYFRLAFEKEIRRSNQIHG